MSAATTVVEEKRKEEEDDAPTSEVIDVFEREAVSAGEKTLILDQHRYRNYGFVGEIITVSEETLSELQKILRKSEHSSVDLLLDSFHRASGIRSCILFPYHVSTHDYIQNSECRVQRVL